MIGSSGKQVRLVLLLSTLAALLGLACSTSGDRPPAHALVERDSPAQPAAHVVAATPTTEAGAEAPGEVREGYGINVKGLNYDDDSLDKAIALNFEWIKIYDHPPAARLPLKVLYRVNLPHPGEDWAEWGHYRRIDAELYAGRIDAYEIGNEPNLREEWGGNPDPAAYARLLEIAYREIKSADLLVVGPQAIVHAVVHANVLIVLGRIYGNVTQAERVEIRPGGWVVGDITTRALVIAEGGTFEGNCRMSGLPEPGDPAEPS